MSKNFTYYDLLGLVELEIEEADIHELGYTDKELLKADNREDVSAHRYVYESLRDFILKHREEDPDDILWEYKQVQQDFYNRAGEGSHCRRFFQVAMDEVDLIFDYIWSCYG